LDLYAVDPDGFEVSYQQGPENCGYGDNNHKPLFCQIPNTGSFDYDGGSIGSYNIAVENISWLKAPLGIYKIGILRFNVCSSDVDFKIIINLDGEITVKNGVAKKDDVLFKKVEVLQFSHTVDRLKNRI